MERNTNFVRRLQDSNIIASNLTSFDPPIKLDQPMNVNNDSQVFQNVTDPQKSNLTES